MSYYREGGAKTEGSITGSDFFNFVLRESELHGLTIHKVYMSRYAAGIHPVPEVLKSRVEFTARTKQFVPAMVVLGKESGNGYIVHAELDNDTKKTDQRIEELLGDGWKINIIIEFDGGKSQA